MSDVRGDPELHQSDALTELLNRAAEGDDAAWSEIVKIYARRLFGLAQSRLRSVELAEEIVQSVLVTVAMKVTGGEYNESGRFESWLFRVAMNRIRDEIRRQKRSIVEHNGFVPDQTIKADEHPFEEDLNLLRQALEKLPEQDREIVELRHHGGMSFKQIAVYTGEPMGTLLARHHRALGKMRKYIETVKNQRKLEVNK